jgi:hypothetical protein
MDAPAVAQEEAAERVVDDNEGSGCEEPDGETDVERALEGSMAQPIVVGGGEGERLGTRAARRASSRRGGGGRGDERRRGEGRGEKVEFDQTLTEHSGMQQHTRPRCRTSKRGRRAPDAPHAKLVCPQRGAPDGGQHRAGALGWSRGAHVQANAVRTAAW